MSWLGYKSTFFPGWLFLWRIRFTTERVREKKKTISKAEETGKEAEVNEHKKRIFKKRVSCLGCDAFEDNGATALIRAADNGHLDVVRLLLDKGADVNAHDNDGITALMNLNGLIKNGNGYLSWETFPEPSYTPLTPAEKEECEELVQMLKAAGAKE